MKRWIIIITGGLAFMVIVFFIFFFLFPVTSHGETRLYYEKEVTPQEDSVRYTRIVKIVKEVTPAVVSITIIQEKEMTFYSPFDDPFFDRFFGYNLPPRKYKYKVRGLGSGVIVSPDGYIITNYHVVEDATNIKVTLTSGKQYEGIVVAASPELDLALVKIKAKNLPFAYLGDSKKTMIGETVIAIGNPFGYLLSDSRPSVSVGVISATDRTVKSREDKLFVNMLQTDAAINPGNSGGPLLNLLGEVIGINTFIFTKSGGSEGIGFAIPSSTVKKFLKKVKTHTLDMEGWIGLYVQDLTQDLKETLNIEENGVIVTDIEDNSPADKAGIMPGDVILSVNKEHVRNEMEWESVTKFSSPGDTLNLYIYREGDYLTKSVIVGKEPGISSQYHSDILGISISQIRPSLRRKYGVYSKEGVIVITVDRHSRGEMFGLLPGDVILQLNGREIKSIQDFKEVEKSIKRYVEIIGERRGSIYQIRVTL